MERVDYNMLEWYGHVVRMEANRWPKRKRPGRRKEDDDEDGPK